MGTELPRSRLSLAAVASLLLANVVVPLLWGDVYPFTSAPMFRDAPQQCCNYHVLGPGGKELRGESWLLQRIYDGNPIGYGVGVRPPAVIEQRFGVVHEPMTVRQHIDRQRHQPVQESHGSVEIVQHVIGPVDSQHVGIVRTARWTIPAP